MAKLKIVIVGGLGFIGHHVTQQLERNGYECSIIDCLENYNLPSDQLTEIVDLRRNRITSPIHEVDIRNYNDINNIFSHIKPDIVINLAGYPRQKLVGLFPSDASATMSTGLINLLEASITHNVKKFVYISSSMVYGNFQTDIVTEEAECNPIGQYGILKLAGELLVKDYARQGLDYMILRPSAVYGEYDVGDRVVAKFITAALRGEPLKVNGANEVLDFTHVEDAAQGIVKATLIESVKNRTFNITRCENFPCTLFYVAKSIIDIAGKGSFEIVDRDTDFPTRGRLAIFEARVDLDYNPEIHILYGLKRYYDWYTQNPTLWNNQTVH